MMLIHVGTDNGVFKSYISDVCPRVNEFLIFGNGDDSTLYKAVNVIHTITSYIPNDDDNNSIDKIGDYVFIVVEAYKDLSQNLKDGVNG